MQSDWQCEKSLPEVSIVKILPRISESQLFSRKKCYLGISLENPLFASDSLKAMLIWAAEKFEQCLVIVGDYLCRFDEQIINGCDETLAGKLAIKRGDSFISQTKDIFGGLPADKVILTRWKEYLQAEEFKRSKKILDEIFDSDEEFRKSVEYDALSFVERQKKHNQHPAVEADAALRLCCRYILEEVAVFSVLSERGWGVELYPGSELRVLAEVARGRYPRVPKGLKNRISVELKIHRQGPR
ncbi:MAG: tRNA-dependent cyclodipeptide synthase [Planctomycetota bacterium]